MKVDQPAISGLFGGYEARKRARIVNRIGHSERIVLLKNGVRSPDRELCVLREMERSARSVPV